MAANEGSLIPFVGVGASQIAGCPGWNDFANKALNYFVKEKLINYDHYEQLLPLSPRLKLHIAIQLEDQHKKIIPYIDLLELDKENHGNGQKLYGIISKLSETIITTNYDKWLDTTPISLSLLNDKTKINAGEKTRRRLYKPEDFDSVNFNREPTVVHLHGSVVDPNTMILTTRDYLLHYAYKNDNKVISFLKGLFERYTVLFIGYGLEELEILDFILQKGMDSSHSKEPKHFILQGYFSHQKELVNYFTSYYALLGVRLLPFSRDHENWDQLINVLDVFSKSLNSKSPLSLVNREIMEGLADEL
ncbi:TPA: hypothetical protein I8Y89_001420 [Legionella pneumophila]|nr:hypothetical protein [Legionella pneumophila]